MKARLLHDLPVSGKPIESCYTMLFIYTDVVYNLIKIQSLFWCAMLLVGNIGIHASIYRNLLIFIHLIFVFQFSLNKVFVQIGIDENFQSLGEWISGTIACETCLPSISLVLHVTLLHRGCVGVIPRILIRIHLLIRRPRYLVFMWRNIDVNYADLWSFIKALFK